MAKLKGSRRKTAFCTFCVLFALFIALLVPLLMLLNYDFWTKFYHSYTAEVEVGGLSLAKIIRKYYFCFLSDPDSETTFSGLWDSEAHLCFKTATTYFAERADLHCYFKADSAFLKLAPAKVEILHRRPLVLRFPNVLSAEETPKLRTLSAGLATMATAYNPFINRWVRSGYRNSKMAFLWRHKSKLVQDLYRKVELLTGLSTATADTIHVASYDSGSHYSGHYDFFDPHLAELRSTFHKMENGNNMASMLVYLSNAPHFGGTVFPRLNLTIFPNEGDGLFWYNIKHDGTLDRMTWHGGCRVEGKNATKWIANVWIRERGQEFRRPCHMERSFYND